MRKVSRQDLVRAGVRVRGRVRVGVRVTGDDDIAEPEDREWVAGVGRLAHGGKEKLRGGTRGGGGGGEGEGEGEG